MEQLTHTDYLDLIEVLNRRMRRMLDSTYIYPYAEGIASRRFQRI